MKQSTKPKAKHNTKRRKTKRGLRIHHRHAAGIDIGSELHYVAVPEDRDPNPVQTFGCTTPELQRMALWLQACRVTTVAIESTGVYWVPVAQVLEVADIEVYLVDARQARNIPGRKTDVQDCQWIQQLHSFGLLSKAFRPTHAMLPLRSLWRRRKQLIQDISQSIQRMHKSFEQMNIQLHKVLSDITGKTGLAIARAILRGDHNPESLVKLCHPGCKRPQKDFIDALTGDYRDYHLFELKQTLETYDFHHAQLAQCDVELQRHLEALEPVVDKAALAQAPDRKKQRTYRRKNQPNFDLRAELYALTGVDLTQIEGIDATTAFTVITEQGTDMSQFPTEKHFASHLGLCPNNRVTGGRVIKRATRKVASRAANALRIAAQSLHRNQSALGAFFRRIRARSGPAKAITATAHKLAKLIYHMLKYKEEYRPQTQEENEARYQEKRLKQLAKQARAVGYELLNPQTGEVLS